MKCELSGTNGGHVRIQDMGVSYPDIVVCCCMYKVGEYPGLGSFAVLQIKIYHNVQAMWGS